MSEVELYLIQDGENCTIYTLQFLRDVESEFEKFVTKLLLNFFQIVSTFFGKKCLIGDALRLHNTKR